MRYALTTPGYTIFFADLDLLPRLLQEQWQIEPKRALLWSGIAAAEIQSGQIFTVPQTPIKVERLP